MKKIFLLAFLILNFLFSKSQIIINELESDAGNYEGVGGDWIELKNIGGFLENMSCYRLSNGGSVILTFPSGLFVPPGAYLLVGNASKMMCNTCDYKGMASFFTLNADGFGTGIGIFSNTIFLNTDVAINGGCGCLTGSGNYNNGSGIGDRVVLFNNAGVVVDAMMFAGGNNYGNGPITVNFAGTSTCGVTTEIIPSISNAIFSGRTICNDLGGCNSSYARIPDGNNGAVVSYDQSGNLACTNCLLPCIALATNTGSTDYPTPGQDNSNSTNTWTATLNSLPALPSSTMTVCGATPIIFTYEINNFINASLVATQPSGNFGSYVTINGSTPINFTAANYDSTSGVTNLTAIVTPPVGNTTYEFVWGDGNTSCVTCPGSNVLGIPTSVASPQKECYVSHSVTVMRENSLGGTITATCTIPGTITINGATGTNIQYSLQKQSTIGGPFVTISGPFATNIIAGIFDDDADTALPNYQVAISTINTVCPNLSPMIIAVPNACLGNPACPKYVTIGTGIPTFTPSNGAIVCANSTVQFTVDINGVCNTGQVEVYYDFNAAFDPYTSGTLLATAGTTVGIAPSPTTATGRVFINEFVVRPAQGACPPITVLGGFNPDGISFNSGEWVELYNAGPGNVDISGWIIADGDWTATIPAGTILNNGLHYLIGGGGTFCSCGVIPDLNLETCNCSNISPSSSDMMNLTNGGEQLALFDCTGTFIDGVLWVSGQGLPDTTANIAPASGCGNYLTQKSVNLPVAASFASSGSISSPNSGKYRNSANAWITSTVTTITPKASNTLGGNWNGISGVPALFGTQCPAPPVTASINITLPDTCSQTSATPITLKAIFKPTPIAPCNKTDVTATASYTIPPCEVALLTGGGEYCEPNTAPVSISLSNPLVGNYSLNLSNGINNVSINPVTGAGPFTTSVANSGLWTIASISAPTGVCPPKRTGSANIIINPIPSMVSAPTSASFCYQLGFDLSSLEPSIITSPTTSQFIWYDSATGGAPIFPYVNPSSSTTYYVAATSGLLVNCEDSVRTPIVLNVNPYPEVPNIGCITNSVTFTPQPLNCLPTPCLSGLEYSVDGINWSVGPTFTPLDPGWAGFGSPSNSLVYFRNASAPTCFNYATFFSPCFYPLPTTLFNFSGRMNIEKTIDLRWQTAQEINVSHFEIEKSADKFSFTKIGKVEAIGNTSMISDYIFNDAKPYNRTNYYRLKIVDIDNQFVYSNVILIESSTNNSSITSLYPNPANEILTIEMNIAKAEKTFIQVIDVLGKEIINIPMVFEQGYNTKMINVHLLANGHYTIRIPLANSILTKNFVKE